MGRPRELSAAHVRAELQDDLEWHRSSYDFWDDYGDDGESDFWRHKAEWLEFERSVWWCTDPAEIERRRALWVLSRD